MITMVKRIDVLERYRVQGQSKRQIAEELKISRNTVDKIVWEYERLCLNEDGECDMAALEKLMGRKPQYNTPKRENRVMTEEMQEVIRKCLLENRQRRAEGGCKLLWRKKDIHARLVELGHDVSYPCVCTHVGRISAMMGPNIVKNKEVYIHREHDPGKECEFDWGGRCIPEASQRGRRRHQRRGIPGRRGRRLRSDHLHRGVRSPGRRVSGHRNTGRR